MNDGFADGLNYGTQQDWWYARLGADPVANDRTGFEDELLEERSNNFPAASNL